MKTLHTPKEYREYQADKKAKQFQKTFDKTIEDLNSEIESGANIICSKLYYYTGVQQAFIRDYCQAKGWRVEFEEDKGLTLIYLYQR